MMPDHVLRDSGLGDIDAEHLEFPVHARCAPEGILLREPTNEGAGLRGDRGLPTTASVQLPGPVQPKALAVPAYQGVRVEDGECLETARPEAVEPDPEEALAATETEPFAASGSDHCQLLTQSEDLQVKDGTAPEQAGQGGEQGDRRCD